MAENNKFNLGTIANNSDALISVAFVGVLVLMIIPIPTMLLDVFLSFSIAFALVILLVAVYNLNPLEFSVFPSLLLLATLYRLALNIASTRLIIMKGAEGTDAVGDVIKSFGQFVVGGDYIVGIIIFSLLVLINFMVITKGAGRIAEVAARFTLDAMPGKQMSIDADLNTGLISDAEAKARREEISREADFFGSMDGASKFVRGDAIAGIVITFVNIIGGLIVGTTQHGMDIAEAAQTYTILTVGDGLVTQIPALIVSTAAGLVVTRAGSKETLGKELGWQIFMQPKAMIMTSVILFFFSLIPGLPNIPFLFLSLLAGSLGYFAHKKKEEDEVSKAVREEEQQAEAKEPEQVKSINPYDVLELEVGYSLIPLVDSDQEGQLLDRIRSLRKQLAMEIGIVVPPVHIRDNLQLSPNHYTILLKGVQIARGELMLNYHLAMNAGGGEGKLKGIPTTEPAFGLPAHWITNDEREEAQLMGYTVVDPATVVTTHLMEVIRSHSAELLGRQELQNMIEQLAETHPKLVEEVVPNLLSLGVVLKVLQNLLRERVSIRDINSIMEALADYGTVTHDPEHLTEFVRQKLSRAITRQYQNEKGEINVITLDKEVEDIMIRSLQDRQGGGSALALDPSMAKDILENLKTTLEKISGLEQPVVLCPSGIRMAFKKLAELVNPHLVALSYDEIAQNCTVKSIGTVRLEVAN